MKLRNLLAAILLVCVTIPAAAAERYNYEPTAFEPALAAGKPILVHVTAPWCGECREQKSIVAALAKQPEYEHLTIFDVDFDTQKDFLRQLRVAQQSTLIVFKNKTEVARATGITEREEIEAIMKKIL